MVVIDPGTVWYSGMATGMLAGQYDAPLDQVSVRDVVCGNGGQFFADRLVGINCARKPVNLESGEVVGYEALSLNLGSEVANLPVQTSPHRCWPVKPIANLWNLRQRLEQRFERQTGDSLRVVVIGGGPTGCEVAACIDALRDAEQRESKSRLSNEVRS